MKTKKIYFAVIFFFSLALQPDEAQTPIWNVALAGESAGSPAVFNQTAIVVTKNGTLSALDNTGKTVWKQKLPAACLASPAVARNNDIFVACVDGSLYRFSADGNQIWRINLEQELLATPLLAAKTVFTVSTNGLVCRIRQKDGVILNKIALNLPVHSSPIWDAQRQKLLLPVKNFYLIALSQDLRVLWKFKTLGVNYSVPAVTPGNDVYFTSMDHHVYKLTGNGRLLWKYKTKGWLKASPVIDEKGRVYFGSYDNLFYALDTDGKLLWQFKGKASFMSSAVLDEAGNIYCGDASGTVYALDRDGKLVWQYKSADFITGDMTILADKILLAGSIDGTLLAFKIDQPMSHKAWWAKCLGNLGNSGYDEP